MFVTRKAALASVITVIILASYSVFRFSPEESYVSVLVTMCSNVSSSTNTSTTATIGSRDGAFYQAADIATRDEDWGRKKCELRKLTNLKQLYDYIKTPLVRCDTQLMLGGHLRYGRGLLDGEKWICLDKKYKVSPLKCLVFSFGIGGDWSFEDDVATKLGCKVFAFDPTIGKTTHNRTARISFFNLGIDAITKTGPQVKRKVDRYTNILAGLGHLNSVIDILKIDVEGYEIPFFKDVFEKTPNLLKNVKMIAMEVHMGSNSRELKPRHEEFWKYYQLLDCFGFKIWHSAVNPFTGGPVVDGQHRSCCYEVVWVQDREW